MNAYEKHFELPRREFLKRAFGAAALAPFILHLESIAAAAQTSEDYKALICVFMLGGNDATGTLIPRTGQLYTNYATARGALAVPQDQILPLVHDNVNSPEVGLHPNCPELKDLYAAGKMAVLANVGPLVAPTTKQQFINKSVPLPKNLFAHDDQISFWQTSVSGKPPGMTGWGGRMADLLASLNNGSQVSISMSTAGSNAYQLSSNNPQYNVSPQGIERLLDYSLSDPVYARANTIWNRTPSNTLQKTWNQKMRRAVDQGEYMRSVLENTPPPTTTFSAGELTSQMKMVAHIIKARTLLNQRRQIFFCGVGGFDTHEQQAAQHPNKIRDISRGIKAIYDATVEMGIADKVTIFTASDFGRTLNINGGSGTDHGWGGHHFIIGGAVQGGKLYGTYPTVAFGSDDDAGSGNWIPTTAVDQYSATLAKWFGVSSGDITTVCPNIGQFSSRDLGFML